MKLKYNHDGTTDTINLVDNPPPMHRLAIHKNNKNFYAKLGEVNHPEASRLKSVRNGKPYAAIKNYDPVLFDECGNQVEFYAYNAEPIKPTIDREIYKFGNSSICFGGNNSSLKISNVHFSSTYTIDFWHYIDEIDNKNRRSPVSFGVMESTTSYNLITLDFWDAKRVIIDQSPNDAYQFGAGILPANTWIHTAFVFRDGVGLFFSNGILQGSKSPIAELPSNSSIYLGNTSIHHRVSYGSGYNIYFLGHIDEFRFSDGIARWTENFTPPTEPYEVDEYTKILMHF